MMICASMFLVNDNIHAGLHWVLHLTLVPSLCSVCFLTLTTNQQRGYFLFPMEFGRIEKYFLIRNVHLLCHKLQCKGNGK